MISLAMSGITLSPLGRCVLLKNETVRLVLVLGRKLVARSKGVVNTIYSDHVAIFRPPRGHHSLGNLCCCSYIPFLYVLVVAGIVVWVGREHIHVLVAGDSVAVNRNAPPFAAVTYFPKLEGYFSNC